MILIYTITIFISASLLFVIQPMFARMILPIFGGSPSVWSTAMVFYQVILLAGYTYTHLSTRIIRIQYQIALHLVMLVAVFFVLPFGIPDIQSLDATEPTWLLLSIMSMTIGFPFFVLSSTSPMIQRWFSATNHPSAADPYFLYAASNVGSLLSLLSYPFLVERWVGLYEQSMFWMGGYIVFVLCMTGCTFFIVRGTSSPVETKEKEENEILSLWTRVRWVSLAFVPSSLMLSVTSYVSTEIASTPLLWVLPLALYLLSFSLVFSKMFRGHEVVLRAFPMTVVALTLLLTIRITNPFYLMLVVHMAVFFIVAMACHGELVVNRPSSSKITEFYLWISIGGALGGICNAILAPILFDSLLEYPMVLIAACALVLPRAQWNNIDIQRTILPPIGLGLLTCVLLYGIPAIFVVQDAMILVMGFGLSSLLLFFLSKQNIRFTLGIAILFFVAHQYEGEIGTVLFSDRGFYGTHRVHVSPNGEYRLLFHGTTVHGMQETKETDEPVPLSYYFPSGPAGEYFSLFYDRLQGPVGVIGMGAGSMASYGKKGQSWTFYEIDPIVVELASKSGYFTYIQQSLATVNIVLGDGRLSLEKEENGTFQLLIIDAFSSDVIPMHLLTREAFSLYMQKIQNDGMILFHISNRHFDLKQTLTDLALDAGLLCYYRNGNAFSDEELQSGRTPSEWMILGKRKSDLYPIVNNSNWLPMTHSSDQPPWTDERSSILDVMF